MAEDASGFPPVEPSAGPPPFTAEIGRTVELEDKPGAKFTVYEVIIENSASTRRWKVLRRYREFDALHKRLLTPQRSAKGSGFPAPPSKAPLFGSPGPKFAENRKAGLHAYVNALLKLPGLIQESAALRSFLGIDDIFRAAATGDLELLEYLATTEGAVRTRNCWGATALMVAAFHGHGRACRFLITAGSEAEAVDSFAQSATALARDAGHESLAEELEGLGCPPSDSTAAPITFNQHLYGNLDPLRPRDFLVIVNPAAGGRGSNWAYTAVLAPLLELCGYTATVHATQGPGDARTKTNEALRGDHPYDAIVAVGGDGLVNEMVNAVAGLVKDTSEGVPAWVPPLGVIPCGHSNGFATSTVTPDRWTAARRILIGRFCTHDVMGVSIAGKYTHAIGSVMWGVIPESIAAGAGMHRGLAAIQATGVKAFKAMQDTSRFQCQVSMSSVPKDQQEAAAAKALDATEEAAEEGFVMASAAEEQVSAKLPVLFVCNVPYVSATFRVASQANGRDGAVDAVLLQDKADGGAKSQVQLLKNLGLVLTGGGGSSIDYHKTRTVSIRPAVPDVPFMIDGDTYSAAESCEIEVFPRLIRVII